MLDCEDTCKTRAFACGSKIPKDNSPQIFMDAEESTAVCSSDTSQAGWKDKYDPIYYPDTKVCAGYMNVTRVDCSPSLTTAAREFLKEAQRLCYCVDPGMYSDSTMLVPSPHRISQFPSISRSRDMLGNVGNAGDVGICQEMPGNVGKCWDMSGNVGKCLDMSGNVGKCRDMSGNVGI